MIRRRRKPANTGGRGHCVRVAFGLEKANQIITRQQGRRRLCARPQSRLARLVAATTNAEALAAAPAVAGGVRPTDCLLIFHFTHEVREKLTAVIVGFCCYATVLAATLDFVLGHVFSREEILPGSGGPGIALTRPRTRKGGIENLPLPLCHFAPARHLSSEREKAFSFGWLRSKAHLASLRAHGCCQVSAKTVRANKWGLEAKGGGQLLWLCAVVVVFLCLE